MWQVKMRHLVVIDSDLVKYLGYCIGCNSIQWLIIKKKKIVEKISVIGWDFFYKFFITFYHLFYNFLLFVLFFNFLDPIQWLLAIFFLSCLSFCWPLDVIAPCAMPIIL